MSSLLRNPKVLTGIIAVGIIFIVGLAGGALGNEFGGGFLSSPIAHIQLRAESITSEPIISDFKITNTMIATWVTVIALVTISFFATRKINMVPKGLQNLVEVFVEFFLNLAESIAGPDKARRFLPLVMTIFLFIVTANWLGVLPGSGTIGRIETRDEIVAHEQKEADDYEVVDLDKIELQIFDGEGSVALTPFGSVEDHITVAEFDEHGVEEGKQAGRLVPFLRSANTEINTTLAIALVAMFMVHYWGFRALGFFGHMGKFITFRGGPIGMFVGILEGISEVARLISFTFRLFGNIFAGEVLLIAMAFLVPLVGIVPFLGLELFVGMIQAFIFSILTLVFAAIATAGHGAEQH